jgi:hypothetical protein
VFSSNDLVENQSDGQNKSTKKPVLFKGYSQQMEKKSRTVNKYPKTLLTSLLKTEPLKPIGIKNPTPKRLSSSSSIDSSISINNLENTSMYLLNNNHTLKSTLRGLLNNGDQFKDCNFQACLIPEKYSNRLKNLHSEIFKKNKNNDSKLKVRSKTIVNVEPRKNLATSNNISSLKHSKKCLSDYLRVRSSNK